MLKYVRCCDVLGCKNEKAKIYDIIKKRYFNCVTGETSIDMMQADLCDYHKRVFEENRVELSLTKEKK